MSLRTALDPGVLQRIAEDLPDSLLLTDADGRILWVNSAFTALLDSNADELCGKPIEELMPAEEVLKLIGFSSHLNGAELVRDFNVFFASPGGTRACVAASVARIRNESGPDQLLVVGRASGAREAELAETTRWAAAEGERADELSRARDHLARTLAALEQTQKALIEASHEATLANRALEQKVAQLEQMEKELRLAQRLEAVGRLSAGVAHEINTPVQFIGDSLHFLREAYDELRQEVHRLGAPKASSGDDPGKSPEGDTPADLEYLDAEVPTAFSQVAIGVQRISKIVQAMKTFARDGRGERCSLNVNDAVSTTLEIARCELRHVADVELQLGDVPLVECDGDQVNQALLNIIVNAAHAIQDVVAKSETRGKLWVGTRADGDAVVISIRDTGTGIPDDVKDRIFDLFFTTKEVGRGTGQGLALVWSVVVDNHGGEVWVDTAVGVGSTFHLKLPARATPRRAAPAETEAVA